MHPQVAFVKRVSQPKEEHHPKKPPDHVRACPELGQTDAIRLRHYSSRTKQADVGWISRYIYLHDVRHPSKTGAPEIEAILSHLATPQPHRIVRTRRVADKAGYVSYLHVIPQHQLLGVGMQVHLLALVTHSGTG